MRLLLPAALLTLPLAALAAPDWDAAFAQPVLASNHTHDRPELRRRDGAGCPQNHYACAALNALGLCCPNTAICSADQGGNVACCPQGAACTGVIGIGAATTTTTTSSPPQTAASTAPFVAAATTTSSSPFVQQSSGSASRSTVSNQFYPFPYIPTTYTNAAACSSAYTSCQGDAASCTSALANGAQGVTISAPNGGVTQTAVASIGLQSAQSVCSSLSSLACYQLTVEACARFDGGSGPRNAGMREHCAGYLMTAGVAVGMAGQLWS